METTAHVEQNTLRDLGNLLRALEHQAILLGREGRYVSQDHVFVAKMAIASAIHRYNNQTPGHD